MLAIAGALEGMSRAEAARLAGMERQALRDAVVRYNAEGLGGLRDRPKPGRPPAPTEAEQAMLLAAVFRGPDRARDGCEDRTLPALCRWVEDRFDKRLHPASLSRVVRRLDLSRQKTRRLHPQADERAKAAFAKRSHGRVTAGLVKSGGHHLSREIAHVRPLQCCADLRGRRHRLPGARTERHVLARGAARTGR
jgi:transposase